MFLHSITSDYLRDCFRYGKKQKKMLVSIYSLLNPNTMDCKRSHKGLHPPANTTNMGPLNFTLPSIKRQKGDLSTNLQLDLQQHTSCGSV